jgi:plasmid stability protein
MISEAEEVPDVLIRDLPPDLHQRLKERAESNRRSLSAEAISLLEEALMLPPPMTLDEIDARRVIPDQPITAQMLEQWMEQGRRDRR